MHAEMWSCCLYTKFVIDKNACLFVFYIFTLMYVDPDVHKKTGRILISGDLASEYGFKDVDGKLLLSDIYVYI